MANDNFPRALGSLGLGDDGGPDRNIVGVGDFHGTGQISHEDGELFEDDDETVEDNGRAVRDKVPAIPAAVPGSSDLGHSPHETSVQPGSDSIRSPSSECRGGFRICKNCSLLYRKIILIWTRGAAGIVVILEPRSSGGLTIFYT